MVYHCLYYPNITKNGLVRIITREGSCRDVDGSPALEQVRQDQKDSIRAENYKKFEALEKTGIQNIHPHRFRRTLATNLLDK